ncbi:MAG: VWA domain-containing protein [Deltaproteobacteria bacterium]|jgi:uncharacterized protein YegL|nr:VWA domain-containing protein [Deltaproteobacteria bacterium]
MARRLPVYLLLDISESMIGPPLESLQNGVKVMVRTLMKNPYAAETLHVGVITFAGRAETAVPLTDLMSFTPPRLSVRPGTSLGAALRRCRISIDRDVEVNTLQRKGDFKPIVFVMTDGEPTDEWRDAARELRERSPRPTVISVGCGDEADFDVLRELSGGDAVRVDDLTPESIQSLFAWVSTSLDATSRAPGSGVDLSKAPLGRGLTLVKKGEAVGRNACSRLFLNVTCAETGKMYVAVYRAPASGNTYTFLGAHKAPDDFCSDGEARGAVESGIRLIGNQECPYCGAKTLFTCKVCKNTYCFRYGPKTVDCPGCDKTYAVAYRSSGSTVYPSQG